MTAKSKRCSTCGKRRAVSQFHRRAASRDGLQARCKSCALAAVHEARAAHPETYQSYNRARNAALEQLASIHEHEFNQLLSYRLARERRA